jgi:amidohydrolase family protein
VLRSVYMRRLIVLALVSLVAGAVAPAARPEGDDGQRGRPPLFDTHLHYSAPDWTAFPPTRILSILDRAGIARALVSSTPDDGTLALYDKAPSRIVPILRPYRTRDDLATWWQDPTVIPYLEERLRRGVHKGIGEFHLHGDQTKSTVIKRLTELAVRRGLILHAHSDEAAIVGLFQLEPRLRIIWAHAGMSSGARAVGALMDRYATLWADLSIRNGDVAPGGVLDPEWRTLLVRHGDRFLIGTDTWTTSRWDELPESIAEVRRYLGQLPRDVAEQIAFKNAERLFP